MGVWVQPSPLASPLRAQPDFIVCCFVCSGWHDDQGFQRICEFEGGGLSQVSTAHCVCACVCVAEIDTGSEWLEPQLAWAIILILGVGLEPDPLAHNNHIFIKAACKNAPLPHIHVPLIL